MKYITILLTLAISSVYAGPIEVFILAGQSKMEEQGVVSMDGERDYNGGNGNLVWSMKHSKIAGKMKGLRNERDSPVQAGNIMDVYLNCEAAPSGRFNYHYTAPRSELLV